MRKLFTGGHSTLKRVFRDLRRGTLIAASLLAMTGSPQWASAEDFSVHWGVITSPHELKWRTTLDWAKAIDFQGVAIRRDAVLIYEHDILLDVRTSGLALTLDPAWWDAYIARLDRVIAQNIPDASATGLAVFDIEFLDLNWGQRTAGPSIYPKSDHKPAQFDWWFDYFRMHRPEAIAGLSTEETEHVLARTYQAAAKDLMLRTIQEAKRLRPEMKWGFYGYPLWRAGNDYARPDPNPSRDLTDNVAWLFEASDAVYPVLYQRWKVVATASQADGRTTRTRDSIENQMRAVIGEARRVAGSKPVYVFTGVRYFEHTPRYEGQPFSAELYRLALGIPKEAGADGILIWDYIKSDAQFRALQSIMRHYVNPTLRVVLADSQDTQQQPTAIAATPDRRAGVYRVYQRGAGGHSAQATRKKPAVRRYIKRNP